MIKINEEKLEKFIMFSINNYNGDFGDNVFFCLEYLDENINCDQDKPAYINTTDCFYCWKNWLMS